MKISKSIKWLGFAVVAVFLSACSDGEYKLGDIPPGLSSVPPSIISFSADKEAINAGESVTLNFEVANADYVEISGLSSDGSFEFQSGQITESASSVVVDKITTTTEFILTATKTTVEEVVEEGGDLSKSKSVSISKLSISRAEGDEGEEVEEGTEEEPLLAPPPSLLTDTASILITVTQNIELDVGIIAEPESIASGEKALLRWWAKPEADVTVSVAGSDGVVISAKGLCGSIEEVEAEADSETVPAVGCAVVMPSSTTDYTITAIDKTGKEHSASTTLTIEEVIDANIEIKSFTVAGEGDLLEVESMPKENVVIAWDVAPETAVVKITTKASGSDSVISDALSGCELPSEGAPVGNITCKVEKEADIVLTVSVADKKLDRAVRVRTRMLNQAEVEVAGPAWAFEGEEIEVTITPKTPADGALVSDVTVAGASQVDVGDIRGGMRTVVNVTTPQNNVNATVRFTNGVTNTYPVTSVMSLRGETLEGTLSSANILKGDIYYGMNKGYNKGIANVVKRGKVTATTYSIPFAELISADLSGFNTPLLEKKVSRFAVGGVDLLDDNSLVVGMSGIVMRQVGDEWKRVRRLTFSSKGYSGSHTSCKGETQTGTTSGEVGGLVDVCDVAVVGTTLLIATDRGSIWMENFPAEHNDPKGVTKETNPTYGTVVNDLEKVDGVVYSAVSAGEWNQAGGIYKFTGSNWELVNNSIAEAYSLSFDGTNLIVGAKDGVYRLTLEGEATKLDGISGPVYSVASASGVIMAGSSTGVLVQRGEKWNPIMSDVLTADVRALALDEEDGNMIVALTGGGTLLDGIAVLPKSQSQTAPEVDEPQAEPQAETVSEE